MGQVHGLKFENMEPPLTPPLSIVSLSMVLVTYGHCVLETDDPPDIL